MTGLSVDFLAFSAKDDAILLWNNKELVAHEIPTGTRREIILPRPS